MYFLIKKIKTKKVISTRPILRRISSTATTELAWQRKKTLLKVNRPARVQRLQTQTIC
jgi:hypothetical protein